MSGIFFLAPQNVLLHSGRQAIHAPTILSGVATDTSDVFIGLGLTSVTVTMNVTGAVTGTSPNLVLTLEELDPGDLTTILQTVSASAMTATLQNRTLRMNLKHGDAVRVKWAVTGTSPVFNGVYTTLTVGEARLPYLGAQATADSLAVNIAVDQVVPVKSEVQLDYNTGGAVQNLSVTGIALPGASGAVAGGTATAPLRVDPTGTTVQPVSLPATPTANLATIASDTTFLRTYNPSLPAGTNNIGDVDIATWVGGSTAPTVGQKVMGASIPVAIASDQPGIKIWDGTNVQPAGDIAARSRFNRVTDGTNTAAVKAASTAAVAADPALAVVISPNTLPIDTTVAGTFAALNDQLVINMAGKQSLGFRLVQGSSLVGLLIAEASVDGSSYSWNSFFIDQAGNQSATITCTGAGGVSYYQVRAIAGCSFLRIKLSVWTSGGSGVCYLRASDHPGFLDASIANWMGSTAPTVGLKTVANSIPVGLPSDQIPNILAQSWFAKVTDGTNTMPTADVATRAQFVKNTDGTNTAAVKAASTAAAATDPALVVAVSPNNIVPTRRGSAGTATLSNVAASGTSVQLLAANTARLRAYIYNDSSIAMVLKYGTTASITSLTTIVQPNTPWVIDDGYTGRVDAIWASATGAARVTELTP